IKKYEDAFGVWQEVLQKYKDFRQDGGIQDDVYEYQIHYVDLVHDNRIPNLRGLLVAEGLLTQAAAQTQGAGPGALYGGFLEQVVRDTKSLRLPLPGPMDKLAPDGQPWIDAYIAADVRRRLGLEPTPTPPVQPGNPGQ